MKKLLILSQEEIEYVYSIAKIISDKRAVKGNFSKAIRLMIEEYKKNHVTKQPEVVETDVNEATSIQEGVIVI